MVFCEFCNEEMFPFALNSICVRARFHHKKHSKCPYAKPAKYIVKNNSKINKALLQDIKENLNRIYACCKFFFRDERFLAIDFKEMLDIAFERDIFTFAKIEVWKLPFILLSLLEKVKINNKEYRFVIENDFLEIEREKYKIVKVFADSGRNVNGGEFLISKDFFYKIDTNWIPPELTNKLIKIFEEIFN